MVQRIEPAKAGFVFLTTPELIADRDFDQKWLKHYPCSPPPLLSTNSQAAEPPKNFSMTSSTLGKR
jgi:hypothetical protein